MTVNEAIRTACLYLDISDVEEYDEVISGEHDAIKLLINTARVAVSRGIVEGDKDYGAD